VLETGEIILEKNWQCTANYCSVWVHRTVRCARTSLGEQSALGTRRRRTTINHQTVRWCTGLSGESSAAKSSLSGSVQRRTAINHGTVRWCTGLSVSQQPTAPTVGHAIRVWRVDAPTVGRGHRTVRCAPDSVRCANCRVSATVGCSILGRRSAPDNEQWMSGAPLDRRQELPSKIASNGS
jgi:hypothetical protein